MIQFYGCSAHILNLLAKDICVIPSASEVLSKSTELVSSIKKSKVTLAKFKEVQPLHKKCTISLKSVAGTRWSSHFYCLESIEINKYNLQQLAIDQAESLKQNVKDSIFSEDFWLGIKKLIAILKPICLAIKKVEEDDSNMYQVVSLFQNLENVFKNELNQNFSLFNSDEIEKIRRKTKNGTKASSFCCCYFESQLQRK